MKWITANFPNLAKSSADRVGAITTTRENGVSLAPFNSFNLATHVGDNLTHVLTNRAILREQLCEQRCKELDLVRIHNHSDKNKPQVCEPYWLEQTHSTTVLQLPAQYFHECATNKVPEADASFTQQPQVICAVMTADCLPLLIVNSDATEVAAIHAGWKGLANGIIEKTINAMQSPNEQLHVWLGPAIGPNAFEVGEDVKQQFTALSNDYSHCFTPNELHKDKSTIKYLADMYQIAKVQLSALGVDYISGGDYCTYSQSDLFFSYRRDGQSGRMASLIWLKS